MNSTDPRISHQGQFQLLGWGDTSTRGRTVTFQLDEDAPEHPFKNVREKKGKQSGQRYAYVLVEIGDDEQPVEKTPAQMAFLLCQNPAFWHFLNERSFVTVDNEETAKACICEGCDIKSRSELDKNPGARSAWLQQFFNPWTAYQSKAQERLMNA